MHYIFNKWMERTHPNKSLFAEEFVAGLEKELGVPLGSKPRGRPKKEQL
jgi:hypothetical protein